jgi:hypothetical protein
MVKRKKYTDNFKAGVVLMLEAEGYPENASALEKVAHHVKVPGRTVSRWFKGESGAPSDNLVEQKKTGLVDLFENELRAAFLAMNNVRDDASYRDLATSAGIFTDKIQILSNRPTVRIEADLSASEWVDMNDDELADLLEAVQARRETEGDPNGSE